MWTVDEARAGRLTGFLCSYRTPGHDRFGVTGAIGCGAGFDSPGARSAVVAGLPEYGEYEFEVAATVDDGPAINWGERALRLRVAVTEDLAGPAGPGLAVSGAGPVITGCGVGDGPGVTAPQRPWRLDRIVSDTHLTHYPGRGWSGGGDPATPPDWPEMPPMADLLEEAGLDGGAVGRVAAGTGEEQQAAAASASAMLADERGAAVVAYISARTKALLRPGPGGGSGLGSGSGSDLGSGSGSGSDSGSGSGSASGSGSGSGSNGGLGSDSGSGSGSGSGLGSDGSGSDSGSGSDLGSGGGSDLGSGWELRLHSSFPFGADYVYGPGHAVAGWGDADHPVAWPALYERTDCPPPSQPDATHDVALALADTAAGGARLEHSGYGWWAVEPVGAFPERIVATKGGLSFGDPTADVPEAPAAWRGRATGHLFWDRQRYAFSGDVTLTLEHFEGAARLVGRIDNVVVSPLDHDTLEPRPGPPVPWRTLTLAPADATAPDAGPASDPALDPVAADPNAADPVAADPNAAAATAPDADPASDPVAADPAAADPNAAAAAAADPAAAAAAALAPDAADPEAAGPAALDPAAAEAAEPAYGGDGDGGWWGAVRVGGAVPGGSLAAMAAAGAFEGDWQAAAYGPAAGEVAGRLRLWVPLADGADPSTWPAQVVLVAGFGAERTS